MNTNKFIEQALGDIAPWRVIKTELQIMGDGGKELHVYLDFHEGSEFLDEKGNKCKLYDTQQHSWRHLNFFEHRCFVHARVPRIVTEEGKVKKMIVPWARRNHGFTLLFESMLMKLIELEMNVSSVAALVKEYAQRIWDVFNYWVDKARDEQLLPAITRIGIDETSRKKGHDYITIGADMQSGKVFHVAKGKDGEAVKALADHLSRKGVAQQSITDVCMDMSPAFIGAAMQNFPKAAITFDHFHVSKEVNKALDEVRKLERMEYGLTRKIRFSLLKNPDKVKPDRLAELNATFKAYPTLGEAYRLKEYFKEFWQIHDRDLASGFLKQWCKEAEQAGVEPFRKVVRTIKAHWSGIVNHSLSQLTNGLLEGINAKVQLAKRRARGYTNLDNFINMIHFLCGNLKLNYPQVFI